MAEAHHGGKQANLGLRALLYASAGMDAKETADFENLLGEDQRTREALSQAVEFLQRWDESIPSLPDAGYRQRVRERLLPRGSRFARGFAALRQRPSGTLVWGAGALAAALLIAVLTGQFTTRNVPLTQPRVAVERQEDAGNVVADSNPMSGEELELWADLPRSRHLLKVHHEESDRKRRSELQMRIVLRDGMGGPIVAKNGPAN